MGLLSTMFGKKNVDEELRLKAKIVELEKTITRKDKEISDLINELDKLNQNPIGTLNSKQLELIEKNLKEAKEENEKMRQYMNDYNFSPKKEKFCYKMDLDKFFSGAKYSELVSAILELGHRFLQDINMEVFGNISPDVKGYEDGKEKFKKFASKEFVDWDTLTYINRGEKLSKVYSKSRKFVNALNDKGMEFMDDISKFDFKTLEDMGFKKKQIDEFENIRDEYYQERRYKR